MRCSGDYQRVFDQGLVLRTPYFKCVYLMHQGPQPRLGLVVSKRVWKSAVLRNRWKRCMREHFRRRASTWRTCDMVIVARQALKGLSRDEQSKHMLAFWQRLDQRLGLVA